MDPSAINTWRHLGQELKYFVKEKVKWRVENQKDFVMVCSSGNRIVECIMPQKGRGCICIGKYLGEEGIYQEKPSRVMIGLELDCYPNQPSLKVPHIEMRLSLV